MPGALVAREMQRNQHLGMFPVAFLDDDAAKHGKKIYGVPVAGGLAALGAVVGAHQADEVVIALPRAGGAIIRGVVDSCREQGVPSRVMPGIYELLDGHFRISRLREVDIADLLRRPQVTTNVASESYVEGCTVVVTGAGGSIGSELSRQVAHGSPKHLVLMGHGENSIFDIASELRQRFPAVSLQTVIADVRDRERISRLLHAIRPDVVFHAAAHKHVPLMEENIGEAITNNVLGTRQRRRGGGVGAAPRLVLVSTDKAVAPSNVMGASKRVAEMIVRDAATAVWSRLRCRPLRERAGQPRQRRPRVQGTDRAWRTCHSHRSRGPSLFHDDSRSRAPDSAGRRAWQGRRAVRPRHGRTCPPATTWRPT